MAHLIDKDAVLAEIERLAEVKPIDEFQPQVQNKIDWLAGKLFTINSLKVFLDTIEVKEVGTSIPDIDDTLKEEGLDPDSKEAKVFKEGYYMALEKLKAQKEEEV